MNNDVKRILNYLQESRNFDFSGYRESMIERRIKKQLFSTNCNDYEAYFTYLTNNPNELDNLIDSFTINVSQFFRNPLMFEYIFEIILPEIIYIKSRKSEASLRVWSAGCAMGEEAYSIAILLNEFLKKEIINFDIQIFATDIDNIVLEKAQKAIYPVESIENVKYRTLQNYFVAHKQSFALMPEIKEMVSFSHFDMLDKKSHAPPESIFSGFDIIFCRNLLIYFNADHQALIFEKLYRSLNSNGYLVLGETEIPVGKYRNFFYKEAVHSRIFRKK